MTRGKAGAASKPAETRNGSWGMALPVVLPPTAWLMYNMDFVGRPRSRASEAAKRAPYEHARASPKPCWLHPVPAATEPPMCTIDPVCSSTKCLCACWNARRWPGHMASVVRLAKAKRSAVDASNDLTSSCNTKPRCRATNGNAGNIVLRHRGLLVVSKKVL